VCRLPPDRRGVLTLHLFIVGAGHVGLVTAVGFLRLGHRVTVADIDAERIDQLGNGRPPIYEPGLEEAIGRGLGDGQLAFTTDLDPPSDARFSIVCVNTPTGPDGPLSTVHVEQAVGRLLRTAPAEHVIVVRSTLPLSGPERLVAAAAGQPRRPAIVTNPEFMREGQALADFGAPSRVVAGWLEPRDEPAAGEVVELYAPLGAPSMIADARSVAMIKLLSNVFLGLKVAYANEVARVADAIDADVDTVIRGVGLDPRIGTAFLKPGPGFGGSCLPEQSVAIALQTAALDVEAPLLRSIHLSNAVHQREVAARLETLLGGPGALEGRTVAVLGLAFKADTDDVRASPGLALGGHLRDAGATVVGHDPRAAATARRADPTLTVTDDPLEAARGADAVLIATDWPAYGALDWTTVASVMRGDLVYDTRAIVDASAVRAAGLRLERLGRAGATAGEAGRAPTGVSAPREDAQAGPRIASSSS